MKFFCLIALFVLLVSTSFSQSTNSNSSTDIVEGYTYDYDMVQNLLIDQKLNPNNKESLFFNELVNSKDFPSMSKFTNKNSVDAEHFDLVRKWIEKHPNEIISALKKAKRFDVLTEY